MHLFAHGLYIVNQAQAIAVGIGLRNQNFSVLGYLFSYYPGF